MFSRQYFIWIIAAVLGTEAVLFVVVSLAGLQPDIKVGVAAYTATPLFVVTLMELARNLRLQRAAFIKDYVSQFFTDTNLYQTFHDLIYTYPTSVLEKIDQLRVKKKLDKAARPVFDPFASLQGDREVGSRFYHPRLFQGSPEERRLDALLGYFDVIAYYYAKGFLRIEDIAGSIGYFLAVMRARAVIAEYMRLTEEAWHSEEYRRMGSTPPFAYLRRLLDDINQYDKRFESRIKKLQTRRL